MAKARDWGQVCVNLDVYKHSGVPVREDPRRGAEYRQEVLEALGFGPKTREDKGHLSEADVRAAREVLGRKAAAFWLEGTPRTTVRFVQHDTVPTGPPVRVPPA